MLRSRRMTARPQGTRVSLSVADSRAASEGAGLNAVPADALRNVPAAWESLRARVEP